MTIEIPAKLLLDVSEVQAVLGIGRSHLYQYLLSGELRSLKLGRRRKIPVEALQDFVVKLEVEQGNSRSAGEKRYGV
jgi:excisionase family DNA binding protein